MDVTNLDTMAEQWRTFLSAPSLALQAEEGPDIDFIRLSVTASDA
jgi:hypothetical protein